MKNKGIVNLILSLLLTATLIPASATAYCLKGTTASGEIVREGICAGGELYFGKSISVYQRKPDGTIGKLIGTYDCLDKGGTEAIKNNYVIDVWRPSYSECQDFMNLVYEDGCKGKVYIVINN